MNMPRCSRQPAIGERLRRAGRSRRKLAKLVPCAGDKAMLLAIGRSGSRPGLLSPGLLAMAFELPDRLNFLIWSSSVHIDTSYMEMISLCRSVTTREEMMTHNYDCPCT